MTPADVVGSADIFVQQFPASPSSDTETVRQPSSMRRRSSANLTFLHDDEEPSSPDLLERKASVRSLSAEQPDRSADNVSLQTRTFGRPSRNDTRSAPPTSPPFLPHVRPMSQFGLTAADFRGLNHESPISTTVIDRARRPPAPPTLQPVPRSKRHPVKKRECVLPT